MPISEWTFVSDTCIQHVLIPQKSYNYYSICCHWAGQHSCAGLFLLLLPVLCGLDNIVWHHCSHQGDHRPRLCGAVAEIAVSRRALTSYSSHILILSHVVHVPCPALCRQEAENAIKTTKNIRHQRPRSTVLHVWLTPTPAGVIRPNGCAAAAVRRYPATNP